MKMLTGVRVNGFAGFLLFEVLIAILIASTALVVILQGLGNALRGSNIAENYFKASVLAEAQLALLEKEAGVKPGISNGRFSSEEDPGGKFSWEEKITTVTVPALFGPADQPICEASLTVKWKERAGERNIRFVTYLPKDEPSPAER